MRLGTLVIFLLIISGCASVESNKKAGVDFSQYKRIAVIKFDGLNEAARQTVANSVAKEFAKKGYEVVGENAGVKALVSGHVASYECISNPAVGGYYGSTVTSCDVSLSIKMTDVADGAVIWSASGSLSERDASGPQEVLKHVLGSISDTIPVP